MKDEIITFVDNFKPKRLQSNMNHFEKEGYNWLKKAVNERVIALTSADKGGAIIIVTPEIIKDITAQKFHTMLCHSLPCHARPCKNHALP